MQRDVLISAVADDQLKEHGVIAVTFASPKETPVSRDTFNACCLTHIPECRVMAAGWGVNFCLRNVLQLSHRTLVPYICMTVSWAN